jgi:hypothetical protein
LLYEALRLAVLTRIMARAGGEESAALIVGTANALFLLMALFLLVDFHRYAAYLPLYTAGKALMVLVAAGCAARGYHRILRALFLGDPALLYTAGGLAGIGMGDLLSAGAGLSLLRRAKAAEGPPEDGIRGEAGAAGEGGGL